MFAVEDSALPKHRKRYMFFLLTRDSSKASIVKLIATQDYTEKFEKLAALSISRAQMRVVLLQLCNSANRSNSIGKVLILGSAACLGQVEFRLTTSRIRGFTVTRVNPGIGHLYY